MNKILLIDDVYDNLLLLSTYLKKIDPNFQVSKAQSGLAGIEIAIKEIPDVILLDIQMPEMDGFEVCEKLKAHPVTSRIPIMFITAVATSVDNKVMGLELGADAFLTKPFDFSELRAQLRVILRIKKAEDDLEFEKNLLEQRVNERTIDLKNIARMYKVLREVTRALVTIRDETEMMNSVCKIIVEEGGYKFAWIGYARGNEARTINPVAHFGIESAFLNSLDISWKSPHQKGMGLIGNAIRTGELAIINDVYKDPDYYPWQKVAEKLGFRSVISLPLVMDNQSFGALNIYAEKSQTFVNPELDLLKELTADLLFGFELLWSREQRAKAENDTIIALKRAKESERVKGIFVANISHEIRTPVHAISGYTELLKEKIQDSLGEQEKEYFEIIHRNCERLLYTIHEILDLSQIEAGAFKINPGPIKLTQIADKVVTDLQPIATQKNILLQSDFQDQGNIIHADEYCITQAISNIVENAIKYTEKGSVKLSIESDENNLFLNIADTGVGMNPEFLNKMFDTFSQEENEKAKMHSGIGLGMALTKSYVEKNQGSIKVSSKPDEGTTVTLVFKKIPES